MKKPWLVLTLLALGACSSNCKTGLPVFLTPAPSPDAGPVADQCTQACGNIDRAFPGCMPVAACDSSCENDQAQGIGTELDLACVLAAGTDRAKLTACHVGCP